MITTIELGNTTIDIIHKDIKNIHLSVCPPEGRVRVAAPLHIELDSIRIFVISKLDWIIKQQKKFHLQERETRRDFIERESHYLWGQRYLLSIIKRDETPSVEVGKKYINLYIKNESDANTKQSMLEAMYRSQIKERLRDLRNKWEPLLGVKINHVFIQRMKTKWGSCNHQSHTLRLNTHLAKKPPEFLEYILVHEMLHIIEPSHNKRFIALMDKHIPTWRMLKMELNKLPL